MHRFYLPPDECQKDSITLSERESRHALNVLRIRPRDRVIVLNGAGDKMFCEGREADRRAVRLKVVRKNPTPPLPCRLTLAQAVTRGRTMELIAQKATELGAHRIVPILSERTVAHVGADRAAAKVEKWEATTIEAIKQCGSAWLPRVEAPLTPRAFLSWSEKFDLSLIASLQSDARHPRAHFESFRAEKKRLPQAVCVWVGPEGDFTPAEIKAVRAAGGRPSSAGPLGLRRATLAP